VTVGGGIDHALDVPVDRHQGNDVDAQMAGDG